VRLVSQYRSPRVAAELEALVVPVLLVGFPGSTRVAPGEYRTATREETPSMPPLASAMLDPDARLLPLIKSGRNPYANFIFVGRASTSDIVLRDASVSKAHAVLERGTDWRIRDNGSHNGTWVNASRLAPKTPVVLTSGDAIVFGAYPAYLIMPDELRRILETMGPPDA
jgi:pSer/pThr/pTyr-binding forkhead associated (FHA) protein